MPVVYRTRTLLELATGVDESVVELRVHLRSEDLAWWNGDVASHQRQLFRLCARYVLPAECADDDDDDDDREARCGATKRRGTSGSVGNRTKRGKHNNNNNSNNNNKKTTTTKSKPSKNKDPETLQLKSDSGIGHLFGETILITYKIEEVETSDRATLLFDDDAPARNTAQKKTNTFHTKNVDDNRRHQLLREDNATLTTTIKLPKRIVVWCYPFDPKCPTAPDPPTGGFPRPEFVPIVSLFRNGNDDAN